MTVPAKAHSLGSNGGDHQTLRDSDVALYFVTGVKLRYLIVAVKRSTADGTMGSP